MFIFSRETRPASSRPMATAGVPIYYNIILVIFLTRAIGAQYIGGGGVYITGVSSEYNIIILSFQVCYEVL